MLMKSVAGCALVFSLFPIMVVSQSLNEFESAPDDVNANITRLMADNARQQEDLNPLNGDDVVVFSNPYSEQGCVNNIGSINAENITGDATANAVVMGDVTIICDGF